MTMSETPIEKYLRIRKLPSEEISEFTFNPTFIEEGGKTLTITGVVLEYPRQSGEAKDTGTFLIGHGEDWYKPQNFLDSIRNAEFTNGRLEVDAEFYHQVGRTVEVEGGKPKIFTIHLSIGVDGVILSGALTTTLLHWQGDGLVYLENEQGRKVEMQSAATPTV